MREGIIPGYALPRACCPTAARGPALILSGILSAIDNAKLVRPRSQRSGSSPCSLSTPAQRHPPTHTASPLPAGSLPPIWLQLQSNRPASYSSPSLSLRCVLTVPALVALSIPVGGPDPTPEGRGLPLAERDFSLERGPGHTVEARMCVMSGDVLFNRGVRIGIGVSGSR